MKEITFRRPLHSIFPAGLLGGKIYSPARLADATDWMRTRPDDPESTEEYGMGLSRGQRCGYTYVGHDGALPGAASVMKYMEDLGVYVGAVTNTDKTPAPGARELDCLIREALLNE